MPQKVLFRVRGVIRDATCSTSKIRLSQAQSEKRTRYAAGATNNAHNEFEASQPMMVTPTMMTTAMYGTPQSVGDRVRPITNGAKAGFSSSYSVILLTDGRDHFVDDRRSAEHETDTHDHGTSREP